MLDVNGVSVNYGESRILNGVSLQVPDGQVLCLMGRNGVGKTTLLKAVMGVLRSRQGHIVFDGKDLGGYAPNQRALAGIGYVPQGRGIFPYLTVYENLLIGLEALSDKSLAETSLEQVYARFPVLKEMRTRAAGTLSGGQQQQLAIGRALVRQPKLLILDEPTEGVQPSIMHQIEEVIVSLRDQGDMSILLVEQFLDFALRVGDRYSVMEKGSIVAEGAINEFNDSIVSEYLSV